MTVALYAGTFDPITNGHLDIAIRASRLFDKLIVGIYETTAGKRILFTTEERVKMAREATKNYPNIECSLLPGWWWITPELSGADAGARFENVI